MAKKSLTTFLSKGIDSLRNIEMDYDNKPLNKGVEYAPFDEYISIAWLRYPKLLIEQEPVYKLVLPSGEVLACAYLYDYQGITFIKPFESEYEMTYDEIYKPKEWFSENGYDWAVRSGYLVEMIEKA